MTRYAHIVLTILFSFLILNPNVISQTHIPPVNVSGIWQKENSPYYIDGEIRIAYGDKLVIEPGVKVIFTGHYKFVVNGFLEAKGTPDDSIYFFPSDTSLGWHGIRFIEAEDSSLLEYCVLKYGKAKIIQLDTSTSKWYELCTSDLKLYELCNSNPNCIEMDYNGGSVLAYRSNPIINHCLFIDNFACGAGGAIAIIINSKPVISYSVIKNNIATDGGGIYSTRSDPTFRNCQIIGNHGRNLGGGLTFRDYCNPEISECIISKNIGGYRGGGICFYTNLKPIVKNSVVSENVGVLGGGIFIDEFYNEFREQTEKIDIKIENVIIDKNKAEYGGGIWIRDTMGDLSGVTISNNRATVAGGGVHIEHNPASFKFSSKNLCSIYLNFAKIMGNDFFKLGQGKPMEFQIDTFTVMHYSALNAEPVDRFPLTVKNFKLTQVNADLYVSPEGNDSNSGLSTSDPLKSIRIALIRILADSISSRTIYLSEGEYIFNETNDVLMLNKHKYVNLKGTGFTEVIFGTDRISVFTPWWITTWALMVYAITLISIIVFFWNVRMRRIKINNELEKERFKAEKMHEVDEMKSRFFANISHEFRTPLTLIFGPAKDIAENCDDKNKVQQNAGIIKRNASRLYNLVNQLLDLSKLEAGKMSLEASEQNIITLLKGYVLSFSSLAERKKIKLSFDAVEVNLQAYIDKAKLEKIINNLLSNAFKFTPDEGVIDFAVKKLNKYVEIRITDNGIGIEKERLDKIFDRFYQVDGSHTREREGTGIGLSLTKELVELHKGKIEVDSEYGKGTTFKILLPLGKEHLKAEEIVEKGFDDEKEVNIKEADQIPEIEYSKKTNDIDLLIETDKPLLLIVEDNSDVRQYIINHLEDEYRILEAANGDDGLKEAIKQIPDLIISDVMMPKMDGFKLCEKLKTDERTSHIPVILLTAKATDKDKIAGYETGADDYIMKPFDSNVLKVRIKNLIEQRKKLIEQFRKEGFVEFEEKNITSTDKKFLKNVLQIINNHLSNTSFGVEILADEVSMSRRNLDRKLVALTGESPGDLISRVRLTHAARLIIRSFGNISEIALEVGFSNPAYFSKCFSKQFGLLPSEYKTNHLNKLF